jgi:CyaY protein
VQDIFGRIARAFDSIDPDQAECEHSFGVVTILFPNRTKIILSAQPSVRQIWLALAAQGTAFHFDFDPSRQLWVDDKGRDIELISILEKSVRDTAGVELWPKK